MIETINVKISELVDGYKDEGALGVVGYHGNLDIRPAYQREFVYKDKQRDAVIESVLEESPLGTMYWVDLGEGKYEVLDGQQRIISICQFVNGDYSINFQYFFNLSPAEQRRILDYTLPIQVLVDMTQADILNWFRKINIAPAVMNEQELRNSAYTGKWLSEAKKYFSMTGCPAYQLASDYLNGTPIRQDYLETAIRWIADSQGISIEEYMRLHCHDRNINELKDYFESTIAWVAIMFPNYRREMKGLDWGALYHKYKDDATLDAEVMERELSVLMMDDEIQVKKALYEYVLSHRQNGTKALNLRKFTPNQKRTLYEQCRGICEMCSAEGNTSAHYKFEEMEADHILPWSRGGKTVLENGRMLCVKHNREISNNGVDNNA